MTVDSSSTSELERAPGPVAGPVRAIERRRRLLPAIPGVPGTAMVVAGGFIVGAAALATVRAARTRGRLRRSRPRRRQVQTRNVVATRSFLVDVHLLGR